jgi:hypothetical protein
LAKAEQALDQKIDEIESINQVCLWLNLRDYFLVYFINQTKLFIMVNLEIRTLDSYNIEYIDFYQKVKKQSTSIVLIGWLSNNTYPYIVQHKNYQDFLISKLEERAGFKM